jgi:hypothetical protein
VLGARSAVRSDELGGESKHRRHRSCTSGLRPARRES